MSSTAEAAAALLASHSTDDAGMALAVATEEAIESDAAEQQQFEAPSSPQAVAPPVAHEAEPPEDEFLLGEPEPEDADWLEPDEDDDEDVMRFDRRVDEERDDEEPNEFEDPEVTALRRQLAAERKKSAHYEGKAAKASRAGWAKEAQKYYPLADASKIAATSRRAFMRDAKAEHDRLTPTFKRFQDAERARLRDQAAKDWGPPVGGGRVPAAGAAQEQRVDNAMRTGNLRRVFREMLG